jgi:hypothetical protein
MVEPIKSVQSKKTGIKPVKMVFPQQIGYVGMEIEQPYRSTAFYTSSPFSIGTNNDQKAIITNPNPKNLPMFIPDILVKKSMAGSDGFDRWGGHRDGSRPWEVDLKYSYDLTDVRKEFDDWVDKNWFCWCSQFTDGAIGSNSAHIHFSLRGNKDLGASFNHQKTLDEEEWTKAWNDYVTLFPFTSRWFIIGKNARQGGLDYYAKPIYERLSVDDVKKIFAGTAISGMFTGQAINGALGTHDYWVLAWSRHNKPQMTIENRLNENHPYWSLPAMQMMSTLIRATITRGKSIKLVDHSQVYDAWKAISKKGVYDGLLDIQNIKFHAGRNIPYICREGQDKVYETGIDLFRAICRRFANSKDGNPLRFGKVMRMFSDFIRLDKIPTHLVWDIDELHKQLYEVEHAKENQDKWLHWGSKTVLDVKARLSSNNCVRKLV